MRAEKLGITLQRFRKYSSSFHRETAGFDAEKRWRNSPFSAAGWRLRCEVENVRRISTVLSAEAVESGCGVARFRGRAVFVCEVATEQPTTARPRNPETAKPHHRNCFISPSPTRANCGSFCIFSSIFSTEYITVE